MVGSRSNSREKTSRCMAALVSYGQPNVHQISYFDFVLAGIVSELRAARGMQKDRASQAVGGLEQREKPLVVQRQTVDVGEHLHSEGAELLHRALQFPRRSRPDG